MTIHFVYATPPAKTKVHKVFKRAIRILQDRGIPISYLGKRDRQDITTWPNRAPLTITAHAYQAFQQLSDVRLYDWKESIQIRGGPNDVLIGHPSFRSDNWGVWERACLHGEFGARIAMLPLSHRMIEHCWQVEPYVPIVDALFGIMGPYWYDTWEESAVAHWKNKIVPIDMALDIAYFPRVKTTFNPPGLRKFFYIGWSGAQKGTELLSILFGLAPQHHCIAIGRGPAVPNVEQRPRADFTVSYLAQLAQECDFFITLGVSDANPTTILEAMAWGFPVCCTPQSGYYNMPEIVQMSITDMQHNQAMLNWLQFAPAAELVNRASAARQLVEKHFTWERFTRTITTALKAIVEKNSFQLRR